MATTQLSYTNLPPNSGVVNPTGTTLVAAPTNDMQLANAEPEKTVLRVLNNDDDTALTITVKAGDHPPALAAGQGDLAVVVAFGTTHFIGPFESGRFIQSDGSLMITSSTTTGTIACLKVPRNT
ncbi:hypothetical protein [Streptomyces stelliscabiei]|uniref:hypothetical protein n=1 Tax=Streptomyces stelliscabiei TaxID=146820 RepID=UPI0029BBCC03|nr:hypothetical protein [Streptomyces stelliscabiei]MDX2667398.1 hypothetical protein [Streptomyces stelliscabiei]MDX2785937.1 hypothetical protein [Streptomyces stelliscabiei]